MHTNQRTKVEMKQHPTVKRMSMRLSSLGAVTAIFAGTMLTVSPAVAAGVTFAQYNQDNGNDQQWRISVSGNTTTISASGTADFLFSGVPGAPGGDLLSNFLLSVTSTTGGATNGTAYS